MLAVNLLCGGGGVLVQVYNSLYLRVIFTVGGCIVIVVYVEEFLGQNYVHIHVCAVSGVCNGQHGLAKRNLCAVGGGHGCLCGNYRATLRLFIVCAAVYAHHGEYELCGVLVALKAARVLSEVERNLRYKVVFAPFKGEYLVGGCVHDFARGTVHFIHYRYVCRGERYQLTVFYCGGHCKVVGVLVKHCRKVCKTARLGRKNVSALQH